ncbi:MAG TPA: hypothetical protein VFI29_01030, partial [Hanamia sp.]|nr:hypothetical protein [Hanamia sp.]
IPCLLNKAPSGGLYTPAERRVRQADCHHLYNYESGFHYPNSRDTLCRNMQHSSLLGRLPGLYK